MKTDERLFICNHSTGIGYADRTRERNGDYQVLAHLFYSDLRTEIEDDCPADLRALIETHMASIKLRQGQQYQVSTSGQTITLGYALSAESQP